jgi:hypothetical protein
MASTINVLHGVAKEIKVRHEVAHRGATSAMWISIFAIAIAMAIFLNVAAVMMNVKSAKV